MGAAARGGTVTPRVDRLGSRPGRQAFRDAERRVASRLAGAGGATSPLHLPRKSSSSSSSSLPSGRWSLLDSPGVSGEPLRADERAEAWARLLLARWGVVSRATLEREDPGAVRWADVAPVLARMEMRGDLRRGEFVEGRGPLQYAEEETVEALRRPRPASGGALAAAGASDPVLDGLSLREGWAVLEGGEALLTLDGAGALGVAAGAGDRSVRAAVGVLQELLRRAHDPLGRARKLAVATIGGRPAAGAPLARVLEDLGFTRDLQQLVWRAL